jgi:hypothetical protein
VLAAAMAVFLFFVLEIAMDLIPGGAEFEASSTQLKSL